MTRSHLDFIFFLLCFCTQNNSQILLFKALEVTIAIHVSAHTQGTLRKRATSKKKQKANKQKNQINFCDRDHGMHSVLRKGEPKVLTCVEPFDFSNILLGRFSRIALGLRANSEFKASFCQSLAVWPWAIYITSLYIHFLIYR